MDNYKSERWLYHLYKLHIILKEQCIINIKIKDMVNNLKWNFQNNTLDKHNLEIPLDFLNMKYNYFIIKCNYNIQNCITDKYYYFNYNSMINCSYLNKLAIQHLYIQFCSCKLEHLLFMINQFLRILNNCFS